MVTKYLSSKNVNFHQPNVIFKKINNVYIEQNE